MVAITIGVWVETESRELSRCPGHYAADWEKHRTKPGRYSIKLVFVKGYTVPMPQWLIYAIDSEIVDGKTYSGFGGVNYSSHDVEKGPSTFPVQTSPDYLKSMVSSGAVELLPGMEWTLDETAARAQTWEKLHDMEKS